MDKEAETITESQANLGVVRGDSVALSALPCLQSSARVALPEF